MIQFSNEVWGLVPIDASLVYKYSEVTFKKRISENYHFAGN